MNKKAFSLTELLVAVSILAILSALGFIYFGKYNANARDVQRKADIGKISSALKLFEQKNNTYPTPGKSFSISNKGLELIKQGKLDNTVILDTLDKVPLDPKIHIPYTYSIRLNHWSHAGETIQGKEEFQIAATLENEGIPSAIVDGDYKTISKSNLPTIITTANSEQTSLSNLKFVFHNQSHNLPYTLSEDYAPFSDGSEAGAIITEIKNDFWQNSNYRTCDEIKYAGKLLAPASPMNYEVVKNGNLQNTTCQ